MLDKKHKNAWKDIDKNFIVIESSSQQIVLKDIGREVCKFLKVKDARDSISKYLAGTCFITKDNIQYEVYYDK